MADRATADGRWAAELLPVARPRRVEAPSPGEVFMRCIVLGRTQGASEPAALDPATVDKAVTG